MANEAFHVNGPAIVCVALPGGTLARLGTTVDGVRVSFDEIQEDIQTDVGGPGPVEVQHYMTVANLDFTLVAYDDSVLQAWLAMVVGGVSYPHGTGVPSGTLVGASGNLRALGIWSAIEAPYTFPYCRARPGQSHEVNLGAKRKGYRISARAIQNIGAGVTATGTQVYNRSAFALPA